MNASVENQLDADQLREGLAQILRIYVGAGMKRFHAGSPPLSEAAVAQLALWSSTPQLSAEPAKGAAQQPAIQAAIQPPIQAAPEPALKSASQATTDDASLSKTAQPRTPQVKRAVSKKPDLAASPPPGQWQAPLLSEAECALRLGAMAVQVQGCRKCEELVCYRRQTVFGEGKVRPRVCFYGEAPGAEEDAAGRPFVGPSGKLLTDIIAAMGLRRDEVYLLNALKCRPPQNRTPLPEEVDNCRPYALEQLELLQPEIIILLGAVAVRSVLQSTESIGQLRGRFHQYHGARVMVTYHPAYLLRTPSAKKLVWEDVQIVMRELANAP